MAAMTLSSSRVQSTNDEVAGGCGQCGASVANEIACDNLFHEIGLKLQSDPTLAALRTQLVDAYCCQHEPYIRSGKSFAAHLVGLCLALEHGQTGPRASIMISRWLNGRGPQDLVKPESAIPRAAMTIADVAQAGTSNELQHLVPKFAESVWQAWKSRHEFARQWTRAAQTHA
jgi:hypothetical protein